MNNTERGNIKNTFKNINKKTKCNSSLNNLNNLDEIRKYTLRDYDIYKQIVLHKLISNLFIRGINDNTINIIKAIIGNIIGLLNDENNSISQILLSSTIIFIVEQNFIHHGDRSQEIYRFIIDSINSLRNEDLKNNLLSIVGDSIPIRPLSSVQHSPNFDSAIPTKPPPPVPLYNNFDSAIEKVNQIIAYLNNYSVDNQYNRLISSISNHLISSNLRENIINYINSLNKKMQKLITLATNTLDQAYNLATNVNSQNRYQIVADNFQNIKTSIEDKMLEARNTIIIASSND